MSESADYHDELDDAVAENPKLAEWLEQTRLAEHRLLMDAGVVGVDLIKLYSGVARVSPDPTAMRKVFAACLQEAELSKEEQAELLARYDHSPEMQAEIWARRDRVASPGKA